MLAEGGNDIGKAFGRKRRKAFDLDLRRLKAQQEAEIAERRKAIGARPVGGPFGARRKAAEACGER